MGITTIPSSVARQVMYKDQWCATPLATLAIPAAAADLTFPDIVFPAAFLSGDADISAINLMLKFRALRDTSGFANALSGATKSVRIKKSTGAWGTDDIVGITLQIGQLPAPATIQVPGMEVLGSIDVQSEVDTIISTTYNVMSEETNRTNALTATGASLELLDVYVGLRVYYHLH